MRFYQVDFVEKQTGTRISFWTIAPDPDAAIARTAVLYDASYGCASLIHSHSLD